MDFYSAAVSFTLFRCSLEPNQCKRKQATWLLLALIVMNNLRGIVRR